jgi:formylmethanofuran--tetrahydromethanopterin N-formyltransferase
MKINGVIIDDTFAEAFPMKATRIIITAMTLKWAYRAANALRGFASSVIACGCEADIERDIRHVNEGPGKTDPDASWAIHHDRPDNCLLFGH